MQQTRSAILPSLIYVHAVRIVRNRWLRGVSLMCLQIWDNRQAVQDPTFQVGRRLSENSLLVPTSPVGIRLTRYVPARMLWTCAADRLLWLLRPLRTLPASEALSSLRKRGGGAKSSAVKVPDFRRACLAIGQCLLEKECSRKTYGLGMAASSLNEDARGLATGTCGE